MAEHPMTRQRVVLALHGMGDVRLRRGVPYRKSGAGTLGMDIYSPPADAGDARPAVVFVTGYADPGAEHTLGRKLKDWNAYVGWAQLVACSGLVAVTYENEDPVEDASIVIQHVRDEAAALGVDAERLAIWSASGNVPNALAQLMRHPHIKCATLLYGYTVDLEGGTAVADAAAQWRFVNPVGSGGIGRLPAVPLMLVRAGRDDLPGLNASMDRFAQHAIGAGVPVTVVNHADAPHGFDVVDDREASRAVIRQVLGYLRAHLEASATA